MTNINQILLARHYLVENKPEESLGKVAYYNAYLLANFGIIVDKPQKLTGEMVETIASLFKLRVPASFYNNPQDTKYFSCAELLVEQLVSYFLVETGTGIYDRVEIFDKDLPQYKQGDEIKLREFKIINEREMDEVLYSIADSFCKYTRPFGGDELNEFLCLVKEGYYQDQEIKCRDNIFNLLAYDISFARHLDKKDMVKLSVALLGEQKQLRNIDSAHLDLIKRCLPLVRNCPMSKKQAKYYNKLLSICNVKGTLVSNAQSPYRLANEAIAKGDIVGAAEIYAANGSLLERNIKYLLSRANPKEAVAILDMLPAKNPIALHQMVTTMANDNGQNRTFSFTKNNRVKSHTETEYEARWRKSRLNSSTTKLLHDYSMDKIKDYYTSLEPLGKVYVADSFFKLGVPTNTSAGNKGIDVIPTGSRILIPTNKIRTFVYWHNAYDIDASLTLVKANDTANTIYFGNYSSKPFGTSILFSGDNRSANGAEYYDIDLAELKAKGYKYVLYHINGYASDLNSGDIFCGYQEKENFNTEAWDPKNIAVQFRVKGNSRAALTFAIDLETNEMVVLNLIEDAFNRVVNPSDVANIKKYLASDFLEVNMGLIASYRASELVTTPEEADIVFDNSYKPTVAQKVIRAYELEKLVALANGADIK